MEVSDIFIENAELSYQNQILFCGLFLHIPAMRWTALLGPSGVGKSSLLRMIAGLKTSQTQFSGIIRQGNGAPTNQSIAYMGQTDLLLPWLTVLGNVLLSYKLKKHSSKAYAEAKKSALALLEQVGLSSVTTLYPYQLSGGMRQRVALIRTLIQNKPIILMDEPFSALDAITRYQLQSLAATLLKNKTVLFITHDTQEALRLADNVIIMYGKPAVLKPIPLLSSDKSEQGLFGLQQQILKELNLAHEATC